MDGFKIMQVREGLIIRNGCLKNIQMDFKETVCDDVNCIQLAHIGSSGGLR
jgi:hypothetical protein